LAGTAVCHNLIKYNPSFDHAVFQADSQIHFLFPGALKMDTGNIAVTGQNGTGPKTLMDHYPTLLISL
jgi:hypothetical protein